MADPVISSSTNRPIFVIDPSGQNSNPMIPDSFISNHLKGNLQSTKLKLTSDASDKAWEVELDGQRFAYGWKGFSISHSVRDHDVLSFRHEGEMVFHVTPFGRSFSQIQLISSTSDDEYDDDDDEHNIFDDDYDEEDISDVGDDDDNSTSEEDLYPEKISSKKRARIVAESSSENSYLVAHVTSTSLRRNHMCLLNKFVRSNGLNNRRGEIDLRNEHGKPWTLGLGHNRTTGQVFIKGGWSSFCIENGIKAGSHCRFKLVENGTKPVLQLCPNISNGNSSKPNEKRNVSGNDGDEIESEDCSEFALMNQNRILTSELKPYMLRSSQLRLPVSFTRENGIKEAGEITVVNKDGVEWKLHLVKRGQFYIRGLKYFFVANGIKKVGDSFTLEVIRGGTSPVIKLCSKVKEASRAGEEMEIPVQKRARLSADVGPSHGSRASNKSSADPGNLQRKQPLQSCSISDQVIKVKQSIVDTFTSVRQFRSELEIKEQNLEVALLEIDALGEKIMGISKFFNMNQV